MTIIISYNSMSWGEVIINQKNQDLLIDLKDIVGTLYPREMTLTCFLPGTNLYSINATGLQHSRILIQGSFSDSYKVVIQLIPQLNAIQKFQSLIINIIHRYLFRKYVSLS